MADTIEIFEVGPRDGLQNEKRAISTPKKISLVDRLSAVGFSRIEVASFVSPKWVPQMADGAEVLAGITRNKNTSYAALSPNLIGFERAIAAGADEVAVFASASEGFSRANINCSISESLDRFVPVLEVANAKNVKVRGYVSCVTDCPYDGKTPPKNVAHVAKALRAMGCYEISLGDTIGQGTPDSVKDMLHAVLADIPPRNLAGHFHNTAGRAMANIEISISLGLRVFDSSVGGLGGCPYAPGAAGNVATELVNDQLVNLGFTTGLDAEKLNDAVLFAKSLRS